MINKIMKINNMKNKNSENCKNDTESRYDNIR